MRLKYETCEKRLGQLSVVVEAQYVDQHSDISEHRIDGFHGTTADSAKKVIEGGEFKPSRGPKLHCGPGVYFWEGSLAAAKNWARQSYGKQGELNIGVLKSRIRLGSCLDFCLIEGRDLLAEFIQKVKEARGMRLDPCTAISMLANEVQANTVRLPEVKAQQGGRKKMFDEAPSLPYVDIIICVRDLSCIEVSEHIYNGL